MLIPNFIFGKIPERMRPAVLRYIMDGITPGDFISAILENNFYNAAFMADDENFMYLREYARMLNALPIDCWGSRKKVDSWMRLGGMNGIKRREEENESGDNNEIQG